MKRERYTDINAKAFDQWVENGWEWGIPITHEQFTDAQNGVWHIVMTPTKAVPFEWFAPYYQHNKLTGVELLGLASGGGQQMPIMAALGATCTVLDYSQRQLDSERMVAQREGYDINLVRADMTQRLPFDDASFDIIIHPVSNCYVEDVYHIWNECHRVLRPGGLLIAGVDNGINYVFDDVDETAPLVAVNKLPYNLLKDPALYEKCMQEDGSLQFSHTMEEQIGGQLQAGFILTHLYEDHDASGPVAQYYPQYIATRARKPV